MALVVKDRIKETTTTTGTGTLTLAGAVTKFQSFSVVGDGNTTYYAIESGNGTDWEIGVGTYTASGTTLSRDTILESSNAGSAINLSGTSTVFCTYPAERSVNTADIGTTIQAYDADIAKYDDTTANFVGTLQNGGSNVVVDNDIGSTVQAYDADTAKYDDTTANFTGNLQKSGANVLTANQTITLSGDVTGSGATSITTTVGNDSHSHTTSTLSGNVSAFTNDSGYITGNQTITLSGDATGSGTTSITVTVVDDSHNHIISNVDGLQTELDGKQPLDADLTAIAGLANTDGNFIVGNGTTWVAESGATARTSLGLGALATLSTVDAATITDNSVGAAELNVSGNGTTSQYLRSDGDGTFTWDTPSGGKILQVVKAEYATQASTTSSTFVNSGLQATITPSSTSSQIIVIASMNHYCFPSVRSIGYAIYRGATQVIKYQGAAYVGSSDHIGQSSIIDYDNPATTSATTYYVKFNAPYGATAYTQFNDGAYGQGRSTIILMEVGA